MDTIAIESKEDLKDEPLSELSYAFGDVKSPVSTVDEISVKSVPRAHRRRKRSISKSSKTDLIYEKLQELEEEAEVLDIVLPFRTIGKTSSLTNVNLVYQMSEPPSPPLTHRQVKALRLNEETAIRMSKQIQKMKNTMEQLQRSIQKSNQKLKQDIDYIVNNVGNVIERNESMSGYGNV